MTLPYQIHSELLESVSRSFYLSIKFLPREMRSPIAVGYLLARSSDTIADSGKIPMEQRKAALDALEQMDRDVDFSEFIPNLEHQGERNLLLAFPEIRKWLNSFDEANLAAVNQVLKTIISGQRWDLEHFTDTNSKTNETELMEYTYRVAGCVGEFWTQVGFINLGEQFASESDRSALLADGKSLGQGLQLINIIRDLHEDLPNQRHYLPNDDIPHWLGVCRQHLEAGRRYVGKVRNRRARFATALPFHLAEATADLLESEGSDAIRARKIKIPRSKVYQSVAKAALFG